MLGSVLLTLVAPAAIASWLPEASGLRRQMMFLVLGLLAQMVGEIALVFLGAKAWMPFFESPFVLGRLIHLFYLLAASRKLTGKYRNGLVSVTLANLALWLTIGVRLLGRLS